MFTKLLIYHTQTLHTQHMHYNIYYETRKIFYINVNRQKFC